MNHQNILNVSLGLSIFFFWSLRIHPALGAGAGQENASNTLQYVVVVKSPSLNLFSYSQFSWVEFRYSKCHKNILFAL